MTDSGTVQDVTPTTRPIEPVTVIVPAYNEAATIAKLLLRIRVMPFRVQIVDRPRLDGRYARPPT